MKDFGRKIGQFFKKQGFYIALFVCVAGLGVAAVLTLTGTPEQVQEEPIAQDVQSITVPGLVDEIAARPTPRPALLPVPSASATPTAEPSPSVAVVNSRPQNTVKLTKPLEGEVTREFAIDRLVYNRTLNQWATHNGIDIVGKEGDKVVAALSGTVLKLYDDPVSGGVVIIDHGSNNTTLYAGVKFDEALSEGVKVNSGDTLGTLDTAPFEEFAGSHLHFEYMTAGEYQDPAKYF